MFRVTSFNYRDSKHSKQNMSRKLNRDLIVVYTIQALSQCRRIFKNSCIINRFKWKGGFMVTSEFFHWSFGGTAKCNY